MHHLRKATRLSFSALFLAAAAGANCQSIDASRCLRTKMHLAQEIETVFSRTISFQIAGFDPFVRRVSGTGSYKVEEVTPDQITMSSSFLYDGMPARTGATTLKDGGRTICWKGNCSISTDASGISINPLFWGVPKGMLHVGQSWHMTIPVAWELGPVGKQIVKVISINPSDDSITLERDGEGDGDAVDEIKQLPLTKGTTKQTVKVVAGRAKWSGYTTFRRGVILSDVLLVERPVDVTTEDAVQSSGTERQYILLNNAPPSALHKALPLE